MQGRCDRLPSREVTRAEMLMCHTEEHVDLVEAASELAAAGLKLNPETYVSEHTTAAARLACGATPPRLLNVKDPVETPVGCKGPC
jgi:acetoin utilization deacetylase AcuC-like enzyme